MGTFGFTRSYTHTVFFTFSTSIQSSSVLVMGKKKGKKKKSAASETPAPQKEKVTLKPVSQQAAAPVIDVAKTTAEMKDTQKQLLDVLGTVEQKTAETMEVERLKSEALEQDLKEAKAREAKEQAEKEEKKKLENKNLLHAKVKKIDYEIEMERKKYETLVKIIKLKQCEIKERLTAASIEHRLKVTELERNIKKLKLEVEKVTGQLERKEYMKEKVTEGYPGERLDRMQAELNSAVDGLTFFKNELQNKTDAYTKLVSSMKDEKQALVDRFSKVKEEHKEKIRAQDKTLETLKAEFGVEWDRPEQQGIQSKQTGRGRRIPKGKKKNKPTKKGEKITELETLKEEE